MTRVIIACAGPQTKWNNHLGVPSHLAPVRIDPKHNDREPLLHNTVRQVQIYEKNDIHITAPPGEDRYNIPGVTTHFVTGSSEFDSTRELWNPTGRTVLLLGDVYFSLLAMKAIMGFGFRRYCCFGRANASQVTGTPYGEIFAHSWMGNNIPDIESHLERVEQGRERGILRPHGWMLLRSIEGVPLNRHMVKPQFFRQINDWTDDIDFREDFERHPATRGYSDSFDTGPIPS